MDDDRELFDILHSTLSDRGYISNWKSDVFLKFMEPLFLSGVEKKNDFLLKEDANPTQKLTMVLIIDLLKKLRLKNTLKVIKHQVGLEKEVLDFLDKEICEDDKEEPILLQMLKTLHEETTKNNPDLLKHTPQKTLEDDSIKDSTITSVDYETALSQIDASLINTSIQDSETSTEVPKTVADTFVINKSEEEIEDEVKFGSISL